MATFNVPSIPLIYFNPTVYDSVVELYWRAPSDNGGLPITSYQVESADLSYSQSFSAEDKYAYIAGLQNGDIYTFNIRAQNALGYGERATFKTVTPGMKPESPVDLNCLVTAPSYFNFSWKNVTDGLVDIKGLQMWLDANDPKYFSLDSNSRVLLWQDRSGNNNNANIGPVFDNQGNSTVTPIYDSINKNVIFDGNSYLALSNTSYINNQYFSIHIVEKIQSDGNNFSAILGASELPQVNIEADTVFSFGYNGNNRSNITVNFLYNDYTYGSNDLIPFTTPNNQQFRIISFIYNSSGRYLYINGNLIGNDNNEFKLKRWLNPAIGQYGNDSYYNGHIKEILIYTGTTTHLKREQIEGYLAWKYDLYNYLTINHQYKNYEPTTIKTFLPTYIYGCTLWLDALDQLSLFTDNIGNTNVENNNEIIQLWKDKSGTNNHAYSNTMRYLENGINDKPSINFTGNHTSGFQVNNNLLPNPVTESAYYYIINTDYLENTQSILENLSNNTFSGNISEIIIYDHALSDSQKASLEGYLSWKWNLNDSLPLTHPYKGTNMYSNIYLLHNSISLIPTDYFGNIIANVNISGSNKKVNIPILNNTTVSNVSIVNKNTYGTDIDRYIQVSDLDYGYDALIQSVSQRGYSNYFNYINYLQPRIPNNNLKLWLDSYDRRTVNINNSNVILWADKSKNQSNASPGISPIYDNSNSFITFNNNYFNLPANTLPSSNKDYTIFINFNTNDSSTNQYLLTGGNSNTNSGLNFYINNSNIYHSWNSNDLIGNFPLNNNFSYLAEFTYTSGNRRTFLNNRLVASDNANNRNNNINNNIIGINNDLSNGLNGSIYDIIIYDRLLSTFERESIETYFTNKRPYISLNGLIVWLDATKYSGTGTWFNQIQNNINATIENGSEIKSGNSIVLNGSTTWRFNNPGSLTNWSISVWIKRTGSTFSSDESAIITEILDSNVNIALRTGTPGTGDSIITPQFYNGQWNYGNGVSIPQNTYQNITVTWNGTIMSTFINTNLITSTEILNQISSGNNNYRIGGHWFDSNYITGEIGEILLYNRPLSQFEIISNYNSSKNNFI
jgi:hypothetical protein